MFVMLEFNNLLPLVTIDEGRVLSNNQTVLLAKSLKVATQIYGK